MGRLPLAGLVRFLFLGNAWFQYAGFVGGCGEAVKNDTSNVRRSALLHRLWQMEVGEKDAALQRITTSTPSSFVVRDFVVQSVLKRVRHRPAFLTMDAKQAHNYGGMESRKEKNSLWILRSLHRYED
ncbi:hypothetical protein GGX14DRAFT_385550 [Mycena pura]|uniref:Secreted protein n=1 Tax=Mycena pura TaxID=153505 RepID=A0AAD6YQV2_9AGAR|nr:hypothetical protein GGX14DRAFT_385550 [Mycena pura]